MVKRSNFLVYFWMSVGPLASADDASYFDPLLQPSATYAGKMAVLDETGRHEIPLLLDVIRRQDACAALTPQQEKAFLNEVMNRLRRLDDPEAGLDEVLVEVARDPKRQGGVREYAVQHLAAGYMRSPSRGKMLEALLGFAKDPAIGTTALLQLHHLRREGVAVDDRVYAELVTQSAARAALRVSDQVTLLAIIGSDQLREAIPSVRNWAATSREPLVVRGAVGVIRKIGTNEDIYFLEQQVMPRNFDFAKHEVDQDRSELRPRDKSIR